MRSNGKAWRAFLLLMARGLREHVRAVPRHWRAGHDYVSDGGVVLGRLGRCVLQWQHHSDRNLSDSSRVAKAILVTLAANTRLEGMDAVDVVFSRLFGGPSDRIDQESKREN